MEARRRRRVRDLRHEPTAPGRDNSAMTDVPLIVAGSLALVGAAIHGVGGELLVVRRLSPAALPSSRFGGPAMTKAMIHAAWHMTTIAFLTVGIALILAGSVLDGDSARGAALVAAAAATGFAAVALGGVRSARSVLRHPAPAVLGATAALAWWGAL
jgi:hypothetical protein